MAFHVENPADLAYFIAGHDVKGALTDRLVAINADYWHSQIGYDYMFYFDTNLPYKGFLTDFPYTSFAVDCHQLEVQ
jgi:hypothetical protein